MLMEMYIFFEIIMIGLFIASFFTKQEILWVITSVISGVLMFSSYNIQYYIYEYNSSIGAYSPVFISQSYPYLMGINLIFFVLALLLSIFDLYDKYGNKFAKQYEGNRKQDENR